MSKKPEAALIPKEDKPKIDPFAPYEPELFVQEYGDYVVLLNKFCVVPHHLLIITKGLSSILLDELEDLGILTGIY